MKNLLIICVFAAATILYSCNTREKKNDYADDQSVSKDVNDRDQKKDPAEAAEEVNENKFESNKAEKAAEFMVKAAEGGMYEVEVGRIAVQKASNAKVKEFAQMMITQHSKKNDELKALAVKSNVTIPAALDNDKRDKISKLSALSGHEFDKEYMDMMVKDHKDDIDKYKSMDNKEESNSPLQAFVTNTLPILQQHLELAKQTQDIIKTIDKNDNSARAK